MESVSKTSVRSGLCEALAFLWAAGPRLESGRTVQLPLRGRDPGIGTSRSLAGVVFTVKFNMYCEPSGCRLRFTVTAGPRPQAREVVMVKI